MNTAKTNITRLAAMAEEAVRDHAPRLIFNTLNRVKYPFVTIYKGEYMIGKVECGLESPYVATFLSPAVLTSEDVRAVANVIDRMNEQTSERQG